MGRKKGELETRKLVGAIIILVVIVVVVLFLASQASGGVIKNFLEMFPSFLKPNYSQPPILSCPSGFSEVGYVTKDNYIVLNGKKTNFYIEGGKVFVKVPMSYDYGRDILLGYVDGGVVNVDFPKNIEQREEEFRKLFPEENDRKLLRRSKIFEGVLCLSDEMIKAIKKIDSCVLTCSLSGGICSSSQVEGKIAFKKLDCQGEEFCYVDLSEKILDSENLHITGNSFFESLIDVEGVARKKLTNILSSDKFLISIPDKIRLSVVMKFEEPFCYSFDTDNEEIQLGKGYVGWKDDSYLLRSDIMSYSGERVLSFVAWNDESDERVVLRFGLGSRGFGGGYEDGEIIKDKEFKEKLQKTEVGKIFYIIGLKKEWEVGAFWNRKKELITTYDYKIVKTAENKVSVYAHNRIKNSWHELYCNKAFVNFWPGYSMKISDVEDSFKETIDKRCMWDM